MSSGPRNTQPGETPIEECRPLVASLAVPRVSAAPEPPVPDPPPLPPNGSVPPPPNGSVPPGCCVSPPPTLPLSLPTRLNTSEALLTRASTSSTTLTLSAGSDERATSCSGEALGAAASLRRPRRIQRKNSRSVIVQTVRLIVRLRLRAKEPKMDPPRLESLTGVPLTFRSVGAPSAPATRITVLVNQSRKPPWP